MFIKFKKPRKAWLTEFIQTKPFPLKIGVGGIEELDNKKGYALLSEYPDMFVLCDKSGKEISEGQSEPAPVKTKDVKAAKNQKAVI
ncbi:MAG: hypothetical protein ACE5DQ_01700 [Candidatus Paceibacterota bacterium]